MQMGQSIYFDSCVFDDWLALAWCYQLSQQLKVKSFGDEPFVEEINFVRFQDQIVNDEEPSEVLAVNLFGWAASVRKSKALV